MTIRKAERLRCGLTMRTGECGMPVEYRLTKADGTTVDACYRCAEPMLRKDRPEVIDGVRVGPRDKAD